jgi:hypothetical protein
MQEAARQQGIEEGGAGLRHDLAWILIVRTGLPTGPVV